MGDESYLPYPVTNDAVLEILNKLTPRFKVAEIENLGEMIPELQRVLDGVFKQQEDNFHAYFKYLTGVSMEEYKNSHMSAKKCNINLMDKSKWIKYY